jgi:hypothetical protein
VARQNAWLRVIILPRLWSVRGALPDGRLEVLCGAGLRDGTDVLGSDGPFRRDLSSLSLADQFVGVQGFRVAGDRLRQQVTTCLATSRSGASSSSGVR